ncbi:MAG: hypothetical protein ACKPCP_11410, partial [Sphaerospermopsis kisseleviana]
ISLGVLVLAAPSTKEIIRSIKLCPGSDVTLMINSSEVMRVPPVTELSCYTAKLYNPNILNFCGTGILPVPLIQIKCTTAYLCQFSKYRSETQ